MDWIDPRHRFDLEYDIVHEKIEAIRTVDVHSFINDRQRQLSEKRYAAQCEFASDAILVSGFQKAGPDRAVHFERGADDSPSYIVHIPRLPRLKYHQVSVPSVPSVVNRSETIKSTK